MTSLTRETHTSVAYYAFREPFFALTFNPPGVQVYPSRWQAIARPERNQRLQSIRAEVWARAWVGIRA